MGSNIKYKFMFYVEYSYCVSQDVYRELCGW